jgi:hypothetical protein
MNYDQIMQVLAVYSKCVPDTHNSDLVGVQEVRWDGGGTEPAGEYTFFMEKGMKIMN